MKTLCSRNPGAFPSQETMEKVRILLRFLNRVEFPNTAGVTFRDKYWIYFNK